MIKTFITKLSGDKITYDNNHIEYLDVIETPIETNNNYTLSYRIDKLLDKNNPIIENMIGIHKINKRKGISFPCFDISLLALKEIIKDFMKKNNLEQIKTDKVEEIKKELAENSNLIINTGKENNKKAVKQFILGCKHDGLFEHGLIFNLYTIEDNNIKDKDVYFSITTIGTFLLENIEYIILDDKTIQCLDYYLNKITCYNL